MLDGAPTSAEDVEKLVSVEAARAELVLRATGCSIEAEIGDDAKVMLVLDGPRT